MIEKYLGGRKAFGFIFLTIVGTCIELFTDRGLSGDFVTLVTILFGTYAAGNVASKAANNKASKVTEEAGKVRADAESAINSLRNEASQALTQLQNQVNSIQEVVNKSGSSEEVQSQIDTLVDNMQSLSDNMGILQKHVSVLKEIVNGGSNQ